MTEFAMMIREYKGHQVEQRPDGYLSATAMCKAEGKLWADYGRTQMAKEFAEALSLSMGIHIDSLIESKEGRPERGNTQDFADFMSAIMHDAVSGILAPAVVSAAVNAGGKMLKAAEMQLKYGTHSKGGKVLQLANKPEQLDNKAA